MILIIQNDVVYMGYRDVIFTNYKEFHSLFLHKGQQSLNGNVLVEIRFVNRQT